MKKVLFPVLVLLTLTLVACIDSNSSPIPVTGTLATVPPDYAGKTNPLGGDSAPAGLEVFKTNCVSCHGPEGHGDGPAAGALNPKPKNLAELQKLAADDYLFWRINTGKPGTPMVAWQGVLTEEQIWQIIAYIRTLQ